MLTESAISLHDVSKVYRMWNSPEARLKSFLWRGVQQEDRALALYRDFSALSPLTLEIPRGQSLGIVGLNGSGKSTLLQLIAGTLQPTTGQVEVHGRLAALLELGAGFNPDFSGRENVYLNAAVLGLTRKEVDARFAAITAFAGIGDFIEQPVKTYSSGMYIRLAFAVLTQVDPEILIIDEALAVGDFLFQQKCYDRIREFRRSGCTFLFVTHGLSTILELCDRAIVLDRGKMIFDGQPAEAVALYEENSVRGRYNRPAEQPLASIVSPAIYKHGGADLARPPTYHLESNLNRQSLQAQPGAIYAEGVDLLFVRFLNAKFEELEVFRTGEDMIISVGIRSQRTLPQPHIGFKVCDKLGRVIFETSSLCMRQAPATLQAGEVIVGNFRFKTSLSEGEYSVVVGFAEGSVGDRDYNEALIYVHQVRRFTVLRATADIIWEGISHLYPSFGWSILDRP
ncbi:MAG: ABC transporter ATP-binding protein [Lacunisphaera sp.]